MAKDFYAVLGVHHNATAQEIRKAYILRTKVLHPDRFDPHTQSVEWKQANEMLKELNEAFSAIYPGSQPEPQPTPPSTNTQKSKSDTQKSADTSFRPKERPHLGPFNSGVTFWDVMPIRLRARMFDRQAERVTPQLKVRLGNIGLNYFLLAVCAAWPVYLACTVGDDRWMDVDNNAHLATSLFAAGLFALNTCRILRIKNSNLGNGVYATPLYFLKTEFDQLRYYPLWKIRDYGVVHHYVNGLHSYSRIKITFDERDESFSLNSRSEADRFSEAIKMFDAKWRAAKAAKNLAYFIDEDDFREAPQHDTRKRSPSFQTQAGIWGVSLVVSLALLAVFQNRNEEIYRTTSRFDPSTAVPLRVSTPMARQPKVVLEPTYPVLQLPSNGARWTDRPDEVMVAPLEIVSRAGDGNYFVKVEDWFTGAHIISFFVTDGMSSEVLVPPGSYRVKYAIGKSWYGTEHLFGPDTIYAKVDQRLDFTQNDQGYSGHTIELFLRPNGNLHTEHISASEF